MTVTSADLCRDAIVTRLEPVGATGTFTLEYVTLSGEARRLVGPVSRSGGDHTDSFHVSNMLNGDQLRTLRASWTVNGVTGVGTRAYALDVLGDYRITCYNTPKETDFTGPDITACTATSSCQWSTRDFKANFLSTQGEGGQGGVNLNGSGIDRTDTAIQIEAFCTNPPANCPAFEGKRYRRPATLRTACGNTPTPGTTVAVWNRHPVLRCGHRILIQGIGCRVVQDTGSGPGQNPDQWVDHYGGIGRATCQGWLNPIRKVIRIN